jgi:hypothetical protein
VLFEWPCTERSQNRRWIVHPTAPTSGFFLSRLLQRPDHNAARNNAPIVVQHPMSEPSYTDWSENCNVCGITRGA